MAPIHYIHALLMRRKSLQRGGNAEAAKAAQQLLRWGGARGAMQGHAVGMRAAMHAPSPCLGTTMDDRMLHLQRRASRGALLHPKGAFFEPTAGLLSGACLLHLDSTSKPKPRRPRTSFSRPAGLANKVLRTAHCSEQTQVRCDAEGAICSRLVLCVAQPSASACAIPTPDASAPLPHHLLPLPCCRWLLTHQT